MNRLCALLLILAGCSRGAPAPATAWDSTATIRAPGFSLEIPKGATGAMRGSDSVFWVVGFPECQYICALEVRFADDTMPRTLEAFVAAVRAEDSAAYGPGPARRFMGIEPGWVVEENCGDCTGAFVFYKGAGTIARVQVTIDDREAHQAQLMAHLLKVAGTFRWGETP